VGLLPSPSFVCRCKTWRCSQDVKFVSFVEVAVEPRACKNDLYHNPREPN